MAAKRTSKKSPSKRSRKGLSKEERRAQILASARTVFAKLGYHHATIDDIVAEAGVARGTFYLYFEDKRAVFSELIDRYNSRINMAILRIVTDDPSRTVENQVIENIRGILTIALKERAMTKILFTDALGVDPDFDRKLRVFYDELVQVLTNSLADGQARGIVRDGEPRVLAYLSIGAIKELLYQVVTLGLTEESAEVLTEQVHAFLRDGYLLEPKKKPVKRRR